MMSQVLGILEQCPLGLCLKSHVTPELLLHFFICRTETLTLPSCRENKGDGLHYLTHPLLLSKPKPIF